MSELETLQSDFLDLKFGMFLHYNMATYQGAQWAEGYSAPSDFDPGGPVDTDAWADAAVSAGMQYAVLTAKHVGGFCLWESQTTAYSSVHPDCPHPQDVVARFVKSFTERGLKVGLYYCWRNPGFDDGEKAGVFKVLPPECDPAEQSAEEQVEFQKVQIRELVERFPNTFYIWNDGLDPRIMPADEAAAFMRSLGPQIIGSANWWDWGRKGEPYLDIAVTETRHFAEGADTGAALRETCWCLEDSWFHDGSGPKSAEDIVREMRIAHSRGAKFLLNVGPDRQGRILDASRQILTKIGALWQS